MIAKSPNLGANDYGCGQEGEPTYHIIRQLPLTKALVAGGCLAGRS